MAIYGFEDWDPMPPLVMELVEGRRSLSFGGGAALNQHRWDLTPDGQRFLINTTSTDESSPIAVVVNWQTTH